MSAPPRRLVEAGPAGARDRIVLAHGAGGPLDSPFLETLSGALAAAGLHVVRFEFDYMAERRATGRRRPPDPLPALRQCWLDVVAQLGGGAGLVLGGKSLGGRVASLVADEVGARGLVCLGYPFHPPDRPERLRVAHLHTLATPALIVQGTRDAFGSREEVSGYALPERIALHWLEDGDH